MTLDDLNDFICELSEDKHRPEGIPEQPAISSSGTNSARSKNNASAETTSSSEISSEVISNYEKQIYDYKQLIQISMSLSSSILDSGKLIESILYTCMAQMRVLGGGMFILKTFDAEVLSLDNNFNGLEPNPYINYEIPVTSKVVNFLCETNLTYTLPELQKVLKNKVPEQISSLNPSLIIPLKQKNRLNGILLLGEKIVLDDNSMLYSQYEREQILIIAGLAAIAINNTTLIEQATTDIMTRLKLKNYFFNVLEDKIDTSVNEKSPLSVLMLDIDFFKKFNDTYGHACGDYVLQAVSKIISDAIRGQDLAGRYGGEEFVVMLFNTNAKEAMIVAERIRKTIENYKYEYEGEKLKVTISIGVSSLDLDSPASAKQLVEFADRALYQSKQNGRNQVSLATKKTPPVKENSNIFFKKQKKSSASKASSVKSHTSAKKSPQINTGKTSSKKRKTVK